MATSASPVKTAATCSDLMFQCPQGAEFLFTDWPHCPRPGAFGASRTNVGLLEDRLYSGLVSPHVVVELGEDSRNLNHPNPRVKEIASRK